MSRYVGYLFVCILWLFVPMGAWAVSKDKNPILIICSYNPAAHQTSVTIPIIWKNMANWEGSVTLSLKT